MISFTRITKCDNTDYAFIENLLTLSFPKDEYRDLEEQRHITETEKKFTLLLVKDNDKQIGFISCWQLDDIHYIEHFAISHNERNKGYGKAILTKIKETYPKIVLEVEKPTDETSRRRISFYQRNGFKPSDIEYIQPAYRKRGNELPMHLMFFEVDDDRKTHETIKSTIYQTIYRKNKSHEKKL